MLLSDYLHKEIVEVRSAIETLDHRLLSYKSHYADANSLEFYAVTNAKLPLPIILLFRLPYILII